MNSQQWTSKLGFVLAAAGSAIGTWGDLEIPLYGRASEEAGRSSLFSSVSHY